MAPGQVVAAGRQRVARRSRTVTLALIAVVVAVFGLSMVIGDYPIPFGGVVRSLLGQATEYDLVVRDFRLPRTITGLLVGIALGLSGALLQSLVRNPLASPDILGVTAGASFSAIFCLLVLGVSGFAVTMGALGGALLTALVLYALAWRNGFSGYRLVLVGIGMAAVLNGGISYLMTRTEASSAQAALVWLFGTLNNRYWDYARPLAICLLVLVPAALLCGRALRILQLGEDTSRGLGARVAPAQLLVVVVAVGLAAVATAAAGPVVFVAFVAAPIARRLVGNGELALVPAALVGACVVL
ncbi:iron ABC transporter permease, partial [Nakamurella silvestris]